MELEDQMQDPNLNPGCPGRLLCDFRSGTLPLCASFRIVWDRRTFAGFEDAIVRVPDIIKTCGRY